MAAFQRQHLRPHAPPERVGDRAGDLKIRRQVSPHRFVLLPLKESCRGDASLSLRISGSRASLPFSYARLSSRPSTPSSLLMLPFDVRRRVTASPSRAAIICVGSACRPGHVSRDLGRPDPRQPVAAKKASRCFSRPPQARGSRSYDSAPAGPPLPPPTAPCLTAAAPPPRAPRAPRGP
jgi:hypothetical protein